MSRYSEMVEELLRARVRALAERERVEAVQDVLLNALASKLGVGRDRLEVSLLVTPDEYLRPPSDRTRFTSTLSLNLQEEEEGGLAVTLTYELVYTLGPHPDGEVQHDAPVTVNCESMSFNVKDDDSVWELVQALMRGYDALLGRGKAQVLPRVGYPRRR